MKPHEADELINRIRNIEEAQWFANREWEKQKKELHERLMEVLNG